MSLVEGRESCGNESSTCWTLHLEYPQCLLNNGLPGNIYLQIEIKALLYMQKLSIK
jgi:hypothetical protein